MDKSRLAQFDELIGNCSKSIQHLKDSHMGKYGLSAAHTDVLCFLLEADEGLTQTELSDMEHMDKAQVSRVIKVLSDKKYVTSKSTGVYNKKYELTPTGKKIATEINKIILNINQFVSDEITEDEINAFYKVFGVISDNLKNAVELTKQTQEDN